MEQYGSVHIVSVLTMQILLNARHRQAHICKQRGAP